VEGLQVPVWVPPMELCTDNAAMIAGASRFLEPVPYPEYLELDATARAA
jgi:N6-L-threonylcarbamoyladenine synthase